MSWVWCQDSGALKDPDGFYVTSGYSGNGPGVNNPDMQDRPGVGPIPCGDWIISGPVDSPHTGHYSLPLTPQLGTQTWGRSEFLIHGDLVGQEGKQLASHGCIILDHPFRERIWLSGDHSLTVIPKDVEVTPAY